eukprot:Lithocolla_globosa_v1_NODE_4558_length_1410_cov_11.761624.p3 type:complete len:105 gc:universal NODE_4558_length_1410_cov_11.761624:208-522(+)
MEGAHRVDCINAFVMVETNPRQLFEEVRRSSASGQQLDLIKTRGRPIVTSPGRNQNGTDWIEGRPVLRSQKSTQEHYSVHHHVVAMVLGQRLGNQNAVSVHPAI